MQKGDQTFLPTIHLNPYPLQVPHLPLHKYRPVLDVNTTHVVHISSFLR